MSGDQAIIHELETHGEEIGMTWRTILAASVSLRTTPFSRYLLTNQSMAMCYNAYLFTLLIPPAILAFINAELGPDVSYTWITISWNLGGAIFVTVGMYRFHQEPEILGLTELLGGRLSDIFGRRYFFLSGSALLILGSIVSATGQTIGQMIAGGAIFGAGSGFLEMSFGAVQVCYTLFELS